jgi:hypothetical protein
MSLCLLTYRVCRLGKAEHAQHSLKLPLSLIHYLKSASAIDSLSGKTCGFTERLLPKRPHDFFDHTDM